jgi:hypothetical protein
MAKNPKQEQADVTTPSTDHRDMAGWLRKIADVRGGEETIKAAGVEYLPKWKKEPNDVYERRKAGTPWWPGFEDALINIAGKPFATPLTVTSDDQSKNILDQRISDVIADVNGSGDALHTFARDIFLNGIANGLAGILVDFPKKDPNAKTLADEKRLGLRPYWAPVHARDILACYYEMIGGKQFVRHMRIRERRTQQDGYGEKTVEQIRVLEPGRFELWQVVSDAAPEKIDEGETSLSYVPFVPFYTGQRFGNFAAKPPLLELANKNIHIYQKLSRKEQTLTLAGFPMLKVRGLDPELVPQTEDSYGRKIPEIEVGPGVVLAFPRESEGSLGDADYISPQADVLTEIREDLEADIREFQRLAKQPMQPGSGNITATANALDASKSNSAIATWALGLKDCLDQALVFTADWMGLKPSASVNVPTDFTADIRPDTDAKDLLSARAMGFISQETFLSEWKRRNMLAPDLDVAGEMHRIETDGSHIDEAA